MVDAYKSKSNEMFISQLRPRNSLQMIVDDSDVH
jgi:hypothetical protein